jgi:hypothetical protein
MDKREFFKKSGAIMAGTMLPRFSPRRAAIAAARKLAEHIAHGTGRGFFPVSIDDGDRCYEAIRQVPGPRLMPPHQQHRREQCEPDVAAAILATCE